MKIDFNKISKILKEKPSTLVLVVITLCFFLLSLKYENLAESFKHFAFLALGLFAASVALEYKK